MASERTKIAVFEERGALEEQAALADSDATPA